MTKPADPFAGLSEVEEKCLREMIAEDMATGAMYDPTLAHNFWEAIHNAADEKLEKLEKAYALMQANELIAAKAALTLIVYDYWFDYCAHLRREAAIDSVADERADAKSEHHDLYCEH